MKIFVDIDGVLNEFCTCALRHVGCPVDVGENEKFPVECGFNILEAARKLHPDGKKFSSNDFWSLFDQSFWAGVPLSEIALPLLDRCRDLVGRENVCLLTANTSYPACAAGKVEWIYKYLPEWLCRRYLIGPQKQFCASPDALLIDDANHNVDAFRAAGGHALLVPRPWNRDHASTETIFERLERFWAERFGDYEMPLAKAKVAVPVAASAAR